MGVSWMSCVGRGEKSRDEEKGEPFVLYLHVENGLDWGTSEYEDQNDS